MWELITGARSNSGQFAPQEKPMMLLTAMYQGRMSFNVKAVKQFGFQVGDKIKFFVNAEKTGIAFKIDNQSEVDHCVMQPYKSNNSVRITSKPIATTIRDVFKIGIDEKKYFNIDFDGEFYNLTPAQ